MLVSMTETLPEDEEETNEWFHREHIDLRAQTDGFIRARRYISVEGSPKYIATYETVSDSVLSSEAYLQAVGNQSEWTLKVLPMFTMLQRLTLKLTVDRLQGGGGALTVVRFQAPEKEDDQASLRNWIADDFVPAALSKPGITGVCLGENMLEAANATGEVARAIGGDVPVTEVEEWLVFVEGVDTTVTASAGEALVSGAPDLLDSGATYVKSTFQYLYGYPG
jgi:hypothetical protein